MSEPVTFDDVEALKETEAALLVAIDGEEHWIPKSQIHDDSEVWAEGDTGTLAITQWLATQKKLV